MHPCCSSVSSGLALWVQTLSDELWKFCSLYFRSLPAPVHQIQIISLSSGLIASHSLESGGLELENIWNMQSKASPGPGLRNTWLETWDFKTPSHLSSFTFLWSGQHVFADLNCISCCLWVQGPGEKEQKSLYALWIFVWLQGLEIISLSSSFFIFPLAMCGPDSLLLPPVMLPAANSNRLQSKRQTELNQTVKLKKASAKNLTA